MGLLSKLKHAVDTIAKEFEEHTGVDIPKVGYTKEELAKIKKKKKQEKKPSEPEKPEVKPPIRETVKMEVTPKEVKEMEKKMEKEKEWVLTTRELSPEEVEARRKLLEMGYGVKQKGKKVIGEKVEQKTLHTTVTYDVSPNKIVVRTYYTDPQTGKQKVHIETFTASEGTYFDVESIMKQLREQGANIQKYNGTFLKATASQELPYQVIRRAEIDLNGVKEKVEVKPTELAKEFLASMAAGGATRLAVTSLKRVPKAGRLAGPAAEALLAASFGWSAGEEFARVKKLLEAKKREQAISEALHYGVQLAGFGVGYGGVGRAFRPAKYELTALRTLNKEFAEIERLDKAVRGKALLEAIITKKGRKVETIHKPVDVYFAGEVDNQLAKLDVSVRVGQEDLHFYKTMTKVTKVERDVLDKAMIDMGHKVASFEKGIADIYLEHEIYPATVTEEGIVFEKGYRKPSKLRMKYELARLKDIIERKKPISTTRTIVDYTLQGIDDTLTAFSSKGTQLELMLESGKFRRTLAKTKAKEVTVMGFDVDREFDLALKVKRKPVKDRSSKELVEFLVEAGEKGEKQIARERTEIEAQALTTAVESAAIEKTVRDVVQKHIEMKLDVPQADFEMPVTMFRRQILKCPSWSLVKVKK